MGQTCCVSVCCTVLNGVLYGGVPSCGEFRCLLCFGVFCCKGWSVVLHGVELVCFGELLGLVWCAVVCVEVSGVTWRAVVCFATWGGVLSCGVLYCKGLDFFCCLLCCLRWRVVYLCAVLPRVVCCVLECCAAKGGVVFWCTVLCCLRVCVMFQCSLLSGVTCCVVFYFLAWMWLVWMCVAWGCCVVLWCLVLNGGGGGWWGWRFVLCCVELACCVARQGVVSWLQYAVLHGLTCCAVVLYILLDSRFVLWYVILHKSGVFCCVVLCYWGGGLCYRVWCGGRVACYVVMCYAAWGGVLCFSVAFFLGWWLHGCVSVFAAWGGVLCCGVLYCT